MRRAIVPCVVNHSWFFVVVLTADHSCESHQDMAILVSTVFPPEVLLCGFSYQKGALQDSVHTREMVLLYSSAVQAMDPHLFTLKQGFTVLTAALHDHYPVGNMDYCMVEW